MEENRLDLTAFAEKIQELKQEISKVIVGQEKAIDLLLTAMLSNGHVLIEGVPGVAKTLTARLIAKLVNVQFKRVQFTPDMMPSDLLGTTVFEANTSSFNFHKGPVFTELLLVDEINRAPAKTQSALFEVMEERQVTMDGNTYKMGDFYTVIATQNPVEQEGTYKLPEAQLDRFLLKITVGYPSVEDEIAILEHHQQPEFSLALDNVSPVLSLAQLIEFRKLASSVYLETSLLRYIAELVGLTRTNKTIFLGASPRASVAIMQSAKAFALLQGRDYVTPGDIKFVAPYVLQHRIQLSAEAEMEGLDAVSVVNRLIEQVEVPQ